ncbi:hypothetical protein ED388_12660 [Muribaculaceae bacterium Isolate-007 (NCI)]|uniref:acyltransferase family protein n=1 Tax=Muribaculum intestinale TaxID=1796646 RepID=UPI000F460836|nr:hypothetical protein EEL42_11870 [Muribaculaceae bacterium Isolate-100 (HZI)]RXE64113.1 hypothetical protein ED388_12660 [Muribaculaceae bacterium Isolate-007 (NCI)]
MGYIDCLKGFAIFLVVLGHVVQNYNLMDSWIFRIIYSFHMPLFMFMSGYCFDLFAKVTGKKLTLYA